jgi:alkylated DNA repair protein (DNA oxidative demethylase)
MTGLLDAGTTAARSAAAAPAQRRQLGEAAWLLSGFARASAQSLIEGVQIVAAAAPFRHMLTPGGRAMSVASTNCGTLGWTSDRRGYRYTSLDPVSGRQWPAMPDGFTRIALAAAAAAGFPCFVPDACLINRYLPGSRLSLHQDRDEQDFSAPIVSVSLGMPAVFLFGGLVRNDRPARVPLQHGDVVVWGGADRLRFHGVMPLKAAEAPLFQEAAHPLLAGQRINLTFRKAT